MRRLLPFTIVLAGLVAASACRPKDTMKPVDFESLDPNSKAASDTKQAPNWGDVRPTRLPSKASIMVLDEPGTGLINLRLLAATDPAQRAASTMVLAYAARDALRERVELVRGQVRIEFGADRLELVVSGNAANSQELLDALNGAFEQVPSARQLATTRGRLLGELPRPDTMAFAVAGATSAVLERPLHTQLVSADGLLRLTPEELRTAWERTFSPDRTLLMVHTDISRANIDPALSDFAKTWPRKVAFANLFRGLSELIDVFHQPPRRERDRRARPSMNKGPAPIVRAEPPNGALKGRPTLVIARMIPLPTMEARALARLTQRTLQSTVDARLSIEGTQGVWLYRVSMDPTEPAESLTSELARLQDQVRRSPQRWELEQAANLWLGARVVGASLRHEDWTAMASEALSLSETDEEIALSLSRDAIAMNETTPEALHEFALTYLLPTRDDQAWRWFVSGVDDQALREMNEPPSP